ncbi:MAG: hypothetical protein ABEH65_00115 [Halobacteriales archaeon]
MDHGITVSADKVEQLELVMDIEKVRNYIKEEGPADGRSEIEKNVRLSGKPDEVSDLDYITDMLQILKRHGIITNQREGGSIWQWIEY